MKNFKYLSLFFAFICFIGTSLLAEETTEDTVTPELEKVADKKEAEPVVEETKSIDQKINDVLAPVSNEIFKYVFAGATMEDSDGNAITYRNGKTMTLPLISATQEVST